MACFAVLAVAFAVLTLPSKTLGEIPNPLAPPSTESPRATFLAYHEAVTEAQTIVRAAYEAHIKEPGWFQSEETRASVRKAQAYLARAARCFDASDVPPNVRARALLEAVLQLDEVLERVAVPPADAIPDLDAMKKRAERGERLHWTVPNTEIRIARVESGPRAGEYLFTPETVSRMYDFYRRIIAIPGEDRFDFYAFYAFSPGDLMPPKWYAWIERLPDWFLSAYYDNALWQWIGLALTVLIAFAFCFAVYHLTWRRDAALRLPPLFRAGLLPLVIIVTTSLAGQFIDELNITGPSRRHVTTALEIIEYAAFSWFVFALSNQIGTWAAAVWAERKQSFDAGIVRVAISVLGITLAVGILVYGANQIGVPLVGILAGLGVGGLAVALAAQPTLENFIGGIMIYADRPVRVGDECKFGDMKGVVEEIGIRSTRLRAEDRSLVSVPNADFSKLRLVNFSRRDRVLFQTKIGVKYGVSEQQLNDILGGMRAVMKNASAAPDSVRVYFTNFGTQAIEIDVVAQVRDDATDVAAEKEKMLIQLFNVIEKSGASLSATAEIRKT